MTGPVLVRACSCDVNGMQYGRLGARRGFGLKKADRFWSAPCPQILRIPLRFWGYVRSSELRRGIPQPNRKPVQRVINAASIEPHASKNQRQAFMKYRWVIL